MTSEEARAYFIDSNERIISVAKDENGYNYETQQIENVFMRRDFEAKEMAIKALEAQPTDKCKGCYYNDGDAHAECVVCDKESQPCEDCISRKAVIRLVEQYPNIIGNRCSGLIADIKHLPSVTPRTNLAETSQDCISRQKALDCFEQTNTRQGAKYAIETLPSVKPKYTDEEIDRAQAVEQAYVDKMVELTVEESRREWLNSFDTSSATKCFEAVNILKQRLEENT